MEWKLRDRITLMLCAPVSGAHYPGNGFLPVFIFRSGSSALLGRPRCGYRSDCCYLPYSIHFSSLCRFISAENGQKTKILEVRRFRMIPKWPPTVTRPRKALTLRASQTVILLYVFSLISPLDVNCSWYRQSLWNWTAVQKLKWVTVSFTYVFPMGTRSVGMLALSPSVYINHSQVVQLTWRQPVPRSLARGKICLFLPSNFPFELRSLATY